MDMGEEYTVTLKLDAPIVINNIVGLISNTIPNKTKAAINLKSSDKQIETPTYEEGASKGAGANFVI